ncbi:hypothetical protein [Roseovarius indicus]|uniref:hypothetical protein n=1 Tax=Roseovarius indicus TaxID=540747 RepID=UPI0032EE676A
MQKDLLIDRILLAAIAIICVISFAIHLWDPVYFAAVYAFEDRLVEYGTALFLLVGSVVLVSNTLSLKAKGMTLAAILTAIYALLFFLGAGEEISWGQRIFGWESSEFFQENNKQMETNFHNLVVGGNHLTKTVFGSGLTAVILLYLIVLPLLYPRVGFIRRLADKLAVPVPGLRHTLFAVAASLVIVAMGDQNRKWEVYELIFSLLMVSIFLMPQNRDKTR